MRWPETACFIVAHCSAAASWWPARWARAGALTSAAAEPLSEAPWSLRPGEVTPPYGHPSRFERGVVRTVDNPNNEPSGSRARTPHHMLKGTITPNGLHFTIMHAGIPDIDPAQHKLLIHGMVRAAACVRSRRAFALPDGDARRISPNAAATARRCFPTNRSRPTCRHSMVLHPAQNGLACRWRRYSMRRASSPAPSGSSPKGRTRCICRAACRLPRPWMMPWLPCTRTASASSRAKAIRCGSICRGTKAT